MERGPSRQPVHGGMMSVRIVVFQRGQSGRLKARLYAAVATLALVASAASSLVADTSPAAADTAPPNGIPATASTDVLPTVQLNGVVWAQVTVGNTVYATGSFTQTWPAGKTNIAANDTPRANLLAFDIRTGDLISSFNHSLNAQGLTLTKSPDGSRVYVGGDFTTVDGQPRARVAAFDAATGALDTAFRPSLNSHVRALTATNSTVYVGGSFSTGNGVARIRLAAFAASNGTLTSWAPKADDNIVTALVVTPDQSEVVIGGRFTTLSGIKAYGLGAAKAVTGAVVPYAANAQIRDYTDNGGIESLATDGQQVYGAGFAYNAGNFEGTFGLSPDTGAINFVNDCHGDTYSVFPVGRVLYSAGHAHNCQWIHQFPDTSPRILHRALAFTTYPTTTNIGPDDYGFNYNGLPASGLLHWYPTLNAGTYTGQSQAAWSVTGNANYVAFGGEFPAVNGIAQQGLVRFAVRSLAPNRMAPASSASLTPAITRLGGGSVRLQWKSTWDQDNQLLTYRVYRDGGTAPVFTTTANSNFWTLPTLTYTNAGLTPGTTHSFVVKAFDPLGNSRPSATASVTV